MSIAIRNKVKMNKERQRKLKNLTLGVKEAKGISWELIALSVGEPRQTIEYRFKHDLIEPWEWLCIWDEDCLGITVDEIKEALR